MKPPNDGSVLGGGNLTPVVRVGNTVRRITGPWSPAVHDLLTFLERRGFDGAPRFLGIDDQGREILSFVEGEVGNYPLPLFMWSDRTLALAARLLRRYHDATRGYVPPPGALWQGPFFDPIRREVICHNDFAPYNMVFANDEPVGIIDFDFAAPGPRIWDVAYAEYRFVPLSWSEDIVALGLSEGREQVRRLKLLCDEYGLEAREELLGMVRARIQFLIDFLLNGARQGNPACKKMIEEGHLTHYRSELHAFDRHRADLERGLAG